MVYQQFSAQSAPDPTPPSRDASQPCPPPYPQSCGNSSQPGSGYQSNPQQAFQSPSQPQRQSAVPVQQSSPQSTQSIVGPQFCAPSPVTFYVKNKLLSWSGGDVSILDGQGGLAFTVDSKAISMRGAILLQDAAGNPVCARKQKVHVNIAVYFVQMHLYVSYLALHQDTHSFYKKYQFQGLSICCTFQSL